MIKRIVFLLLVTIFSFDVVDSQNTVGLISYDITQSFQGYTLIYPHNQSNVFLINNCGEIVHKWEDEAAYRPGNTAYLLEDGVLLKTKRHEDISHDSIWAGGGGAIVELRTWENDLIWSYELNSADARLHHDIEPLPNGNILMVAWERKFVHEAVAAGRDSSLLNQNALWPEVVYEVNPMTNVVVWEWHAWDHLIQDFDSLKPNYGVISEHPELININWDTNNGAADWMHCNAIDYNPELDQIMLSIPQFNEIWIIDHSTSTAQAASHKGGIVNKGGDLLYRVGNVQAYNKGTSDDQILFYQHDAHWANDFLPENHPYYNSIVCFNNRLGSNYSSIEIFQSSWMMYIGDYESFQGAWPPFEFDNTVFHPDTFPMYSTGLSSAQVLPNGNILACSGRTGYQFELTPKNDIVWEYITPLRNGNAVSQGDSLMLNDNLTFRSFRYPIDYSAFDNRDLTPKGFIELNPDESYCARLVDVSSPEITFSMIYPNPAHSMLHVLWDSGELINIQVFDALGRLWIDELGNGGMTYLDVSMLDDGLYYVVIDKNSTQKFIKF